MSTFLFVPRDTVLHRLHPVTKLVCLVLGFALALLFSWPEAAAAALLLSLAALAATGGLAVTLRRMWKLLVLLLVVTTLIWSLFLKLDEKKAEVRWQVAVPLPWARDAEGQPQRLKLIEASPRSLEYGAAMGLRLTACVVLGLAFLASTRTEDFALALRLVGLPSGVSLAVSLSFRLVPTLAVTGQNVLNAQRARGVDPSRGNLFRRLVSYAPLVTPVLAYALRGADSLAMALESRGLGAATRARTSYRVFAFGGWDWVALLLAVGLLAAGIALRVAGYGVLIVGSR